MAFNFLQKKTEKIVSKIKAKGMLSEENILEILQEIKLILLESDVNLKVVNSFISQVKEKALGEIVEVDRTSSQKVLKIIYLELTKILGNEVSEWSLNKNEVVMFVGLQGSGKTTSVAKLANYLTNKTKNYKKPLLVGLDVYRPAAMDQLEKLASDLKFDFFSIKNSKDVSKIAKKAMDYAQKNDNDLIILDTAGRLQTNKELMQELKEVKKLTKPGETIFVADAMSGQDILNVAKEFNIWLNLSSIIITKLDSNAKGGAALSITSVLNLPIKFIGTGEKIGNFELFYPDRMASRILGLGDIESLTEKAQEISEDDKNEKLYRKILAGKYDLDDLLFSMKQMAKMGSIGSIGALLPGFKLSDQQTDSAERKMLYFEILITSMTAKEKKNPKLLKHPKRKERIIQGSGRSVQEYNDLLRQFEKSQKQMKAMAKYLKAGKMPNIPGQGFGKFGR